NAAGHVGLEQGGVDQVGPPGVDQPLGPPGPTGPPAVAVKGEQPRPGGLELVVDAGTVDEEGDVELDPPADVGRGHGGERALGPPGPKTVDQIQDAHATLTGTTCFVHACESTGAKC